MVHYKERLKELLKNAKNIKKEAKENYEETAWLEAKGIKIITTYFEEKLASDGTPIPDEHWIKHEYETLKFYFESEKGSI